MFKLTKDILNKRICDVEEHAKNDQTYLEFIRQSEKEFEMEEADLNIFTEDELNEYFKFLDYLWDK